MLAGGTSSEREVSMTTGKAIHESLRRQGHEVLAIDPASGRTLLDHDGKFLEDPEAGRSQAGSAVAVRPTALVTGLNREEYDNIDLVFLALHGGTGENGSIQNLLELSGKRFTGSSMVASAIAMNKAVSKRLFSSVGVATPEWELYSLKRDDSVEELSEAIIEDFNFPVIVKPNASGSTVGLTKVDGPEGLAGALKRAAAEGRDILVERYIKGREITVAVLDGHAFPVVEIIPKNELYDYEAKYTKGKSEYVAPAIIAESLSRQVRNAAVAVYQAIGASGLARVDFVLAEPDTYYCLELNTLPGMTGLSLAPMAAGCEGISFDELVTMIIKSALKRSH